MLRSCGITHAREEANELCDVLFVDGIKDMATKKILSDFCSDFGTGYLEEQLKRCDVCIVSLEQRRNELSSELPSKQKLYATLCISGALALIILLI